MQMTFIVIGALRVYLNFHLEQFDLGALSLLTHLISVIESVKAKTMFIN